MSRPGYESEDNRRAERRVKRWLERNFGWSLIKLENRERAEWDVRDHDGILVEVAEFKERNIAIHSPMIMRDGVMLSNSKALACQQRATREDVPFTFYVMDRHALWACNMDGLGHWPVKQYSGRTFDTRDVWDVEPCVMIPGDQFERLASREEVEQSA